MATYAIGDVQGCLLPLKQLLTKINYHPQKDTLWFTGDLINRGHESLATLEFIRSLPESTVTVLGNHDLTLLAAYHGIIKPKTGDTYAEILQAPNVASLITWLSKKPLLFHDDAQGYVLCHAGIYPLWDLNTAKACAQEVENHLQHNPIEVLKHMYGNAPALWHENLKEWDRIRFIINTFTRMRFCDAQGSLDFSIKEAIQSAPSSLRPWFALPQRILIQEKILFGHWAALQGQCPIKNIYALDSGCVWGNALTAFCLQTEEKISIECTSPNHV